jgi:hypothetical protein
MDAVRQVLHELINIVHGHGLPKGRADELHDILNGVTEVAEEVINGSYDRSNPADRQAEIAALEKELADLHALDASATSGAQA